MIHSILWPRRRPDSINSGPRTSQSLSLPLVKSISVLFSPLLSFLFSSISMMSSLTIKEKKFADPQTSSLETQSHSHSQSQSRDLFVGNLSLFTGRERLRWEIWEREKKRLGYKSSSFIISGNTLRNLVQSKMSGSCSIRTRSGVEGKHREQEGGKRESNGKCRRLIKDSSLRFGFVTFSESLGSLAALRHPRHDLDGMILRVRTSLKNKAKDDQREPEEEKEDCDKMGTTMDRNNNDDDQQLERDKSPQRDHLHPGQKINKVRAFPRRTSTLRPLTIEPF